MKSQLKEFSDDMRFFPTRPLSARCATAFAVAASLLFAAGARPASAQSAGESPKVGSIRLGAFLPANSDFRNTYSNSIFAAGLDYFVSHKPGVNRTVIGVDYIQRNSGDKNIRIIPVTISEQYYGSSSGTSKMRGFFGIGAGAYFLHIKNPENGDVQGTKDPTTAGGFLEAGLDFTDSFYLDARYHFIGEEYRTKPTGLEVSLGARF